MRRAFYAMWKSSSYRRVLEYAYHSEKLKKNLDVKHWILVHFHAEMAIFYTEYLNIT